MTWSGLHQKTYLGARCEFKRQCETTAAIIHSGEKQGHLDSSARVHFLPAWLYVSLGGCTHRTEGLDSVNETALSLYLHCTTAPIWWHHQQLFGWDPCTKLAVTSQQFQPLLLYLAAKMKALLLYVFKGSCPSWSKAKGGKRNVSNHLSFESVYFSVNTYVRSLGKVPEMHVQHSIL